MDGVVKPKAFSPRVEVSPRIHPFVVFIACVATGLGGQAVGWNQEFNGDIWEYLGVFLIMGCGYFSFTLCMAEMSSVLPFGGGLYALVRLTLGPSLGYFVGWCEVMQNAVLTSLLVILVAEIFIEVFAAPPSLQPVYWLTIFVLTALSRTHDVITAWKISFTLAFLSINCWLAYLIGSAIGADSANLQEAEERSAFTALASLPYTSWFFLTVSIAPIISHDMDEPKNNLPWTLVYTQSVLFCMAVIVLFLTASQPESATLSDELFPMKFGFQNLLSPSRHKPKALILCLPLVFVMTRTFLIVCTRQIASMAGSGLLPGFLKGHHEKSGLSHTAFVATSLLCFFIAIVSHAVFKADLMKLFALAMFGNYAIHICFFCCYIVFKRKYVSLQRKFQNPLGVVGAAIGIMIFSLAFVSDMIFQQDRQRPVVIFTIIILLGAVYYFAHGRFSQCFSEEEQKFLFVAYVINANVRSRHKMRSSKAHSHLESSGRSVDSSRSQTHPHFFSPHGSNLGNDAERSTSLSISASVKEQFSKSLFSLSGHSSNNFSLKNSRSDPAILLREDSPKQLRAFASDQNIRREHAPLEPQIEGDESEGSHGYSHGPTSSNSHAHNTADTHHARPRTPRSLPPRALTLDMQLKHAISDALRSPTNKSFNSSQSTTEQETTRHSNINQEPSSHGETDLQSSRASKEHPHLPTLTVDVTRTDECTLSGSHEVPHKRKSLVHHADSSSANKQLELVPHRNSSLPDLNSRASSLASISPRPQNSLPAPTQPGISAIFPFNIRNASNAGGGMWSILNPFSSVSSVLPKSEHEPARERENSLSDRVAGDVRLKASKTHESPTSYGNKKKSPVYKKSPTSLRALLRKDSTPREDNHFNTLDNLVPVDREDASDSSRIISSSSAARADTYLIKDDDVLQDIEEDYSRSNQANNNGSDPLHVEKRGNGKVVYRRSVGEVFLNKDAKDPPPPSWIPALLRSIDPNDPVNISSTSRKQLGPNSLIKENSVKFDSSAMEKGDLVTSAEGETFLSTNSSSSRRNPSGTKIEHKIRGSFDALRNSFGTVSAAMSKAMPILDDPVFEHYTQEFVSTMLEHAEPLAEIENEDEFSSQSSNARRPLKSSSSSGAYVA